MLTFICFLLILAGNINWLLVGLLQYDFVAGIFGYQASIFSRLIYIIIGAASLFIVFKLIKEKGKLNVFSFKKKEKKEKNEEQEKKKESALNASDYNPGLDREYQIPHHYEENNYVNNEDNRNHIND